MKLVKLVNWKKRDWDKILIPEFNGKEYFLKSQLGSEIARRAPETMSDNQQEDEQLLRQNYEK